MLLAAGDDGSAERGTSLSPYRTGRRVAAPDAKVARGQSRTDVLGPESSKLPAGNPVVRSGAGRDLSSALGRRVRASRCSRAAHAASRRERDRPRPAAHVNLQTSMPMFERVRAPAAERAWVSTSSREGDPDEAHPWTSDRFVRAPDELAASRSAHRHHRCVRRATPITPPQRRAPPRPVC
jgi:hypothetical protein